MVGRALAVVPDDVPFEVAARGEPMAVARHAVNRTGPKPGATVLAVGADTVINSAEEDVAELHGTGATAIGRSRAGTDIYLDAAGVPAVIDTAKQHATLGIVAVHKKPVPVDFQAILASEVNIVTAMGYPTEIFEVTREIAENQERFGLIVSDRFPFGDVQQALTTASTPGAADKVVVTFD